MTKEERLQLNHQYLQRIREGDKAAYNDIIKLNEPLITKIIFKQFNHVDYISYDELLQEGRLGAIEAVDYYLKEAEPKYEFSTYLANSVIFHIFKFLKKLKKNQNKDLSLNNHFKSVQDETLDEAIELVVDQNYNVEDQALEKYDNEKTLEMIDVLLKENFSTLQIDIFKTYKLLQDGITVQEAANQFGVSKQYISYTVNRILSYLKLKLNNNEELKLENGKKPLKKDKRTTNVILANLDKPEQMEKIKLIIDTRLSDIQRQVVKLKYFGEKPIQFIEIDKLYKFKKGKSARIDKFAQTKIERELERIYSPSDMIKASIKDAVQFKRIKTLVKFICNEREQQTFEEIYINEQNANLKPLEILRTATKYNQCYYSLLNKIQEVLSTTSSYYLTDVPKRLLDILGVTQVDAEIFYNAFFCLGARARDIIYNQYFIKSTMNAYDPKAVQKLKDIYFILLKEKQQEENE